VFLCVGRTLFRTSLVMGVRRNFSNEQCRLSEDDRVTETCRSFLRV